MGAPLPLPPYYTIMNTMSQLCVVRTVMNATYLVYSLVDSYPEDGSRTFFRTVAT